MIKINNISFKNKLKLSDRIVVMRESLITYLPMVMLCALFLFSVWLVRSVNQTQNNALQLKFTHIAEYEFKKFNLKSYELNGKLKSSLHGEFAQHFLDTKNTEVNSPFILIYTKNKITSANAKKAIVNEDGSQLQLIGQTLMKREDVKRETVDMQISGEFLHFFTKTDKLESHLPVKIIHGNNIFNADRLMADNLNQVFELKGRVQATISVK